MEPVRDLRAIGHELPRPAEPDGSVRERRFVALFERGSQLVAAVGFGRARQLMGYRMQIAEELRRERTS